MRYLNKIVFINSASVSYAEIELDGNVHFIGTQGVGKSTLLRAILFFYNADKMRLGIPREKKRFDDYYFQFENSYIVYEIVREGNPYCVLAYKKNGRVVLRFFDSAYRQGFFVENNQAFGNWEKIRTVLHKNHIYHSKTITSYEEFRKIIYGDNKGLKPEFRKYALLESKQFQNIPRTIQNVLLNSKLEAKFIKETIIQSLNEEEIKIDLQNYSKSHLRDFETELNDIKIWSKKNKSGQIVVRRQAKAVIDNYMTHNFLLQERQEIALQLAARLHYIEQQKPKLSAASKEENNLLHQREKEVLNLAKLHKNREQNNISDIRILKSKLKEAANKKAYYEAQNITEVQQKVAQKENLAQEGEKLREEKHLLTANFSEISHKYEALIGQANNQLLQFETQKNALILAANSQFLQEKNRLSEDNSALLQQLREEYQERLEQANNRVENHRDEFNKLDKAKASLRHKEFFKDELEGFRKKANKFQATIADTKQSVTTNKGEINTLRREWELEELETNRQADSKINRQKEAKTKLANQVNSIQNRLERQQTSLYGWLNGQVKGWEHNIGKVIDEDVLFNKDLAPELSDKSENLYGVKINLNALQSKVKTVDQYQAEIVAIQGQIESIDKKIQALLEAQKTDLDRLKKRFQTKINGLKDKIAKAEYELARAKTKLSENKSLWNNKILAAKEEKEQQIAQIDQQLNKAVNDRLNAERELDTIRQELKRKEQRKNREKDQAIQQAKQATQATITELKTEITQQKNSTQERIKQLQAQQNTELESKGADSIRLKAIENRLEIIATALAFIKDREYLVIEYNKDKREFFDKIPLFKEERDALEKKQLSMEKDHALEKLKLDKKCASQREKVLQTRQKLQEFEADLHKFEEFKKSEAYPKLAEIIDRDTPPTENSETAIDIINRLNETTYKTINRFSDLRKSISGFTGNFKEHNVFSFKITPSTDDDYLDFARDLKEFIEEDKINDYQKRVNERFAHIIQLIGNETQRLISKEAEIEKIIKKINNDFSSKNFVGAIKKMEIRMQESSNKIMKLLLAIKQFNDDNAQSLGEVNLFNASEENRANKNEKAVELLKKLVKDLNDYRSEVITLSESFDLQFRIVENDNDSGWVEKLSNVGSEGTDVLVKAMLNILLLNVFKESASKKFKDFKLHCMMDEVGRLHPTNVKGILRFANDRNILLINGSPTSLNAMDYRYTYNLSKKQSKKNKKRFITQVTRLIKAR